MTEMDDPCKAEFYRRTPGGTWHGCCDSCHEDLDEGYPCMGAEDGTPVCCEVGKG